MHNYALEAHSWGFSRACLQTIAALSTAASQRVPTVVVVAGGDVHTRRTLRSLVRAAGRSVTVVVLGGSGGLASKV